MPRRIVFVTSILVLAATGLADAGPPPTNTAQNVAIAEALFKYVNQRNFDQLDVVVAENVVRHSVARAEIPVTNRKEFKELIKRELGAVPDGQYEINIIFGGGDMVAVHATYRGTQIGPMGSFAATGKTIEMPFMGILRIEGGLVAEIWFEWDSLTAMKQLGHAPGE